MIAITRRGDYSGYGNAGPNQREHEIADRHPLAHVSPVMRDSEQNSCSEKLLEIRGSAPRHVGSRHNGPPSNVTSESIIWYYEEQSMDDKMKQNQQNQNDPNQNKQGQGQQGTQDKQSGQGQKNPQTDWNQQDQDKNRKQA